MIFTIYQGVLVSYKSYLDSKDTLIIHESTEIFEDSAPYGGNETNEKNHYYNSIFFTYFLF